MAQLARSPFQTGALNNSTSWNNIVNALIDSINAHSHDPADVTNGFGGVINPATGAIPADTSETAVSPTASGSYVPITTSQGIAVEIQRIRGQLARFTGGNWFDPVGPVVMGGVLGSWNITTTGDITADTFTSTTATGQAPFFVSSVTKVANLNADMVDGFSVVDSATTQSPGSFPGKLMALDSSGYIPPSLVNFDATESISTSTGTTGTNSIINNLNRIRYEIAQINIAAGGSSWLTPPTSILASLSVAGDTPLGPNPTLSGGVGIQLQRSGNNIQIIDTFAATGSTTPLALLHGDYFSDSVITGLVVTNPSSNNISIAPGTGYNAGQKSTMTNALTFSVPSGTWFIDWNGTDGGGIFNIAPSGGNPTAPAPNSGRIRLAKVVSTGSAITSIVDMRQFDLTMYKPNYGLNYGSGYTNFNNTAGGVLNVGNAPFDGSSTNAFQGVAGGTGIAVNMLPGFAGNLQQGSIGPTTEYTIDAGGKFHGPISDRGGQVYNVLEYGLKSDCVLGGSVGILATGTDNTAALNALIVLIYTKGGGTIFFPAGNYLFLGQIVVNSTAGLPNARSGSIRFTGTGKGEGLNNTPRGSRLVFQYTNTAPTGNGPGKVWCQGYGFLEFDNLQFYSDVVGDTNPHIFITNPIVDIHDNSFYSTTSYDLSTPNGLLWTGKAPVLDAIQIGALSGAAHLAYDNTLWSNFEGYTTQIVHNTFGNIRRMVIGSGFANNCTLAGNTLNGANVSTPWGASIDLNNNGAWMIRENQIETMGYSQTYRLANSVANTIIGDTQWDPRFFFSSTGIDIAPQTLTTSAASSSPTPVTSTVQTTVSGTGTVTSFVTTTAPNFLVFASNPTITVGAQTANITGWNSGTKTITVSPGINTVTAGETVSQTQYSVQTKGYIPSKTWVALESNKTVQLTADMLTSSTVFTVNSNAGGALAIGALLGTLDYKLDGSLDTKTQEWFIIQSVTGPISGAYTVTATRQPSNKHSAGTSIIVIESQLTDAHIAYPYKAVSTTTTSTVSGTVNSFPVASATNLVVGLPIVAGTQQSIVTNIVGLTVSISPSMTTVASGTSVSQGVPATNLNQLRVIGNTNSLLGVGKYISTVDIYTKSSSNEVLGLRKYSAVETFKITALSGPDANNVYTITLDRPITWDHNNQSSTTSPLFVNQTVSSFSSTTQFIVNGGTFQIGIPIIVGTQSSIVTNVSGTTITVSPAVSNIANGLTVTQIQNIATGIAVHEPVKLWNEPTATAITTLINTVTSDSVATSGYSVRVNTIYKDAANTVQVQPGDQVAFLPLASSAARDAAVGVGSTVAPANTYGGWWATVKEVIPTTITAGILVLDRAPYFSQLVNFTEVLYGPFTYNGLNPISQSHDNNTRVRVTSMRMPAYFPTTSDMPWWKYSVNGGYNTEYFQVLDLESYNGPTTTTTAPISAAATAIPVTNRTGFTVGGYLRIADTSMAANGYGASQEMAIVSSITVGGGNTGTINITHGTTYSYISGVQVMPGPFNMITTPIAQYHHGSNIFNANGSGVAEPWTRGNQFHQNSIASATSFYDLSGLNSMISAAPLGSSLLPTKLDATASGVATRTLARPPSDKDWFVVDEIGAIDGLTAVDTTGKGLWFRAGNQWYPGGNVSGGNTLMKGDPTSIVSALKTVSGHENQSALSTQALQYQAVDLFQNLKSTGAVMSGFHSDGALFGNDSYMTGYSSVGAFNATYNTVTGYIQTVLADAPLIYYRLGETSGSAAINCRTAGTLNGTYQSLATGAPLSGGVMASGSYVYAWSYVLASGQEVFVGTISDPVVLSGGNNQVTVTVPLIPTTSPVVPLATPGNPTRKVYRSTVNAVAPYGTTASPLKLIATVLTDNTTTTVVDNTPDGSLGAVAPGNPIYGTWPTPITDSNTAVSLPGSLMSYITWPTLTSGIAAKASFSAEIWVKPQSFVDTVATVGTLQTTEYIIAFNSRTVIRYVPPISTSPPKKFLINSGGTGVNDMSSVGTYPENTWYHLVYTWDTTAQTESFYVNGALDTSRVVPGVATAALAGVAGNVDTGNHAYAVSYVVNGVETSAGGASNTVATVIGSNGQVNLTNIPLGPTGTTSRNIYRTKIASGTVYFFLINIPGNSTTTYTDNTADSGLGAGPPLAQNLVIPDGSVTGFLGTNGASLTGSFRSSLRGNLNEFAVYPSALTPAKVLAHYNAAPNLVPDAIFKANVLGSFANPWIDFYNNGSNLFRLTQTGNLLGTGKWGPGQTTGFTPTAYLHPVAGGSVASTAPVKFSTPGSVPTLLATPERGAFEYDGNRLLFTPGASTQRPVILANANTLSSVLSNTNSNTSNNTIYTYSVPANELHVGQVFVLNWTGRVTQPSGTTLTLGFRMAGTLLNSVVTPAATVLTDSPIRGKETISVQASTKVWGFLEAMVNGVDKSAANTAQATINAFNAANDITISAQWNNTAATGTLNLDQIWIEVLN
jgi:hypothetical protein